MKQEQTQKCDFCKNEATNCVKLINDDWSTRCVPEDEKTPLS